MQDNIRISVLMAIYNCASTLEEALDSMMAQTYQGFKIILCDDCSTDNTYEVAKNYIKRFPDKFILLKNEKNMKLSATLNKCLEYADTEYIGRMDGDDICKPERFEQEIQFLDSNPKYSFVSCPMEYFNEKGIFRTGVALQEPDKYCFIKGSPFCHAPVLIRTDAIKAVKGYTVKSWTQRAEDYYLWAKLMSRGFKGFNLSTPLYMMRDDENAFKRRTFKSRLLNIRLSYEAFKLLKIPMWYLIGNAIHNIAAGILPFAIYQYFHKKNV